MTWGTIPEWISAVSTIAALTAILAAVTQMRLQSQQIHRELESQYTQRFWSLWDSRPTKFFRTNTISRSVRPWVESYLALSNDQVELRERGRVTDDTWDYWARDIVRFCNSYDSLAIESRHGYPSLHKLLTSNETRDLLVKDYADNVVIDTGPVYDPLEWSERRRRSQGLAAPKWTKAK